MTVTIKDIAKIANVSYATVSRALSGHKEISESTRKKINQICKDLNYTPNGVARGLVKKNSKSLGLMVPDITNPLYSEITLSVESEARKRGFNTILCNTDWSLGREEEYFMLLTEKRVEGIIIDPVSDETENLIRKYYERIPIVFAGSNLQDKGFNYVVTDDFRGTYIATEYLIKTGHRKIVFIGGKENSNTFRLRLSGYKKAMADHAFGPAQQLIRTGSYKKDGGRMLTRLLLDEGDFPTAIVAVNDIVALGVIEAIEEFGMKVPDDISVIGFDDISYSQIPRISLTTVRQSKADLGRYAVDLIFEMIDGKKIVNSCSRITDVSLIVRKTCKELKS